MKLIVSGIEHEFLSEPTPRQLHEIYLETLQPPIVKELYEGELGHLYKANGWQCAGMLVSRDTLHSTEVARHLHLPEHIQQGIGTIALIGPIEERIMQRFEGMHGTSVWVRSHVNHAVSIDQSAVH